MIRKTLSNGFAALLLVMALGILLSGCGGSGGGNNTSGTGAAALSITWPTRSRLIPAAANSIRIIFTQNGAVLANQLVPRPAAGGTSSVTVNNLKVGALVMTATAYPNADGTGVAQATGSTTVNIADNQTTNVTLTMNSTIDHLEVTPSPLTVVANANVQVVATAKDASGAVVLTTPGKFTYNSATTSAATIDTNGLLHGVLAGSSQITVVETESGKQVVVTANVTSPAPKAFYVLDETNKIKRFTDFQGSGWATYGGTGSGVGQFNVPTGVALDSQGRIYISDRLNNRIVRINDMSGAGWTTYGSQGSGVGQFSDPLGIAIDGADHIYVSDYSNHRIVRMNDISGSGWTTLGSPQIALTGPTGLTTDSSNRLYIADTSASHVIRVDDITGANYISLGAPGVINDVGKFGAPTGVALDNSGRIYVADPGQGLRVVRVDDMTGANWTDRLISPSGSLYSVAVDEALHIYNTDRTSSTLERWDSFSGNQFSGFGSFGGGSGGVGDFFKVYFVLYK
jgi:sugar lactone lactonase YvrE